MLLEFEKPIFLLEEKLALMKAQAAQKKASNLKQAITKLEHDIRALQVKTFQSLTRWQRVQVARHADRPYTGDYIRYITDEFIELHGDRLSGDDPAIVGGLGTIAGQTLLIVGHQKGRNTKERQARNFGMASPEGYRKALRLMQLAEKFGKPIVTFIDTPGAYPGIEAESRGQAAAIATIIQAMFTLRVPILCLVIGEGASGGALGLGVGDRVLMLEHAWYSIISPEACAAILWKNKAYKEQAAEMLQLTAADMLRHQLIDGILPEPLGGAHRDAPGMAAVVKQAIVQHMHTLGQLPVAQLLQQRLEKFCNMGVFAEQSRHPERTH